MACEPVSFNNISASTFELLKRELENNGFSIAGTSGTIHGPFNIIMDYTWDEATETLHTKVVNKSFFVPCSQIYNQLSNYINKYTA
jgi:hypothetical protein